MPPPSLPPKPPPYTQLYTLMPDEGLLGAVGMTTLWELVAAIYAALHVLKLISQFGPHFRPYLGSRREVLASFSSTMCYTVFWLIVFAIKWTFEYFMIIKPMIQPSMALWNFRPSGTPPGTTDGPPDFFCWDYNWIPGRKCYYENSDGTRGFGDGFREFGFTEEQAGDYLLGLRWLRSYFYKLMLLLLRWSTPTLLIFADTSILYSLVSAFGSFLLAYRRNVYKAFSWSATVRNIAVSVHQFNTKVLAQRGVTLLEHMPEWYLRDGVQREVPSLEACSTQWHAFAVAWNRIVQNLRSGDLLSNIEQVTASF